MTSGTWLQVPVAIWSWINQTSGTVHKDLTFEFHAIPVRIWSRATDVTKIWPCSRAWLIPAQMKVQMKYQHIIGCKELLLTAHKVTGQINIDLQLVLIAEATVSLDSETCSKPCRGTIWSLRERRFLRLKSYSHTNCIFLLCVTITLPREVCDPIQSFLFDFIIRKIYLCLFKSKLTLTPHCLPRHWRSISMHRSSRDNYVKITPLVLKTAPMHHLGICHVRAHPWVPFN